MALGGGPWRPERVALLERSVELEPTLHAPGLARRLVRDFLRAMDHPDWCEAGELAVSEVVTNAALHAHTAIELRMLAFHDQARVEVRDWNTTLPVARDYDRQATTGRGMGLVSVVATDCGVRSLEDGKVVWFCVGDPTDVVAEDLLAAWGTEEAASSPEECTEVVLRSFPVTLWLSARQHHDAILRELVLYEAEHGDLGVDLAAADRARSAVSNAVLVELDEARAVGTARPPLPDGHPSPLPWVPADLDLEIRVPSDSAGDFALLQDALDVAEHLAVAGELLNRPGLPEVIVVRDWACEQVIAQLAGVTGSAWPGTADERFETAVEGGAHDVLDWDPSVVTDSERSVIAADDANRIIAVSASFAALVGWERTELVGRRVVTVIPPALREAHVAGFSRHLTTGEAHVLGVPLTLPVLRRDGREIMCDFLVEQPAVAATRPVYFAWISPVA